MNKYFFPTESFAYPNKNYDLIVKFQEHPKKIYRNSM